MTKEQQKELKDLQKRQRVLDRQLLAAHKMANIQIAALNARQTREQAAIDRAAKKAKQKVFNAIHQERKQFYTALTRLRAERTPEHKERAAILKRIAILEGRLAS